MRKILLCSPNPLLVRSLSGVLRDAGHAIEEVEHSARAVQRVIESSYDLVILDAGPFGITAEDTAGVIGAVAPGLPIICVGEGTTGVAEPPIRLPADPAAIMELIQGIAA